MRGPIALLFGWLLVSAWRNEVESLRMAPVRRGRIGASSAPRSITLELGSSSMQRIYGDNNGERELLIANLDRLACSAVSEGSDEACARWRWHRGR